MTDKDKPAANYGIRVSLPEGDTFAHLLDPDWHTEHWYDSRMQRDAALLDMQREHEYSRSGDAPTLVFTPVDRTPD